MSKRVSLLAAVLLFLGWCFPGGCCVAAVPRLAKVEADQPARSAQPVLPAQPELSTLPSRSASPARSALPVLPRGVTVFAQGEDSCRYYRIPAMTVTAKGEIVVAADRRYESWKDIGLRDTPIDVAVKRSTDGGRSWSGQTVIARGDPAADEFFSFGDPSLHRTADGTLLCLMACGRRAFFDSIRQMAVCSSEDGGISWSAPRAVPFPDWVCSAFVASGTGLLTPDGSILAAADVLTSPGTGKPTRDIEVHLVWSEDGGRSWTVDRECAFRQGDESKLELLPDGTLLLSVRRRGGERGFNTAVKGADGLWHWGEQWNSSTLRANACNADILRFSRRVLLHTYLKDLSARRDLTLAASTDGGRSWFDILTIQPLDAAYSTMVLLPGGDVGVFYEDGSRSTDRGYDLVFRRIPRRLVRRQLRSWK